VPRVARIATPGVPHHATQRGNTRQDVFFVDDDYRVYRELLCQLAELNRVEIHGYCLMANHVDLVTTPPERARPGRERACTTEALIWPDSAHAPP
jgi:putative transposase